MICGRVNYSGRGYLARRHILRSVRTLLSELGQAERNELFESLNYLNQKEYRSLCHRHSIPYKILIQTPGAQTRVTSHTDRKPVVMRRIRHYLMTGEVQAPTCFPARVVQTGPPPKTLKSTDRLYYDWYKKTHTSVMRVLEALTDGRFRDGALARVLVVEFWTKGEAPTFTDFARAWMAAKQGNRDLLTGKYAYLTDLRKKRAGTDWKAVRQAKAASVLKTLDGIHHPSRANT